MGLLLRMATDTRTRTITLHKDPWPHVVIENVFDNYEQVYNRVWNVPWNEEQSQPGISFFHAHDEEEWQDVCEQLQSLVQPVYDACGHTVGDTCIRRQMSVHQTKPQYFLQAHNDVKDASQLMLNLQVYFPHESNTGQREAVILHEHKKFSRDNHAVIPYQHNTAWGFFATENTWHTLPPVRTPRRSFLCKWAYSQPQSWEDETMLNRWE
tara:strand:+ start:5934 stop:6563 length:630 start_codon:yes stop_codon:yes gene_type:complete